MTSKLKKSRVWFILILVVALLSACGSTEVESTKAPEAQNVTSEQPTDAPQSVEESPAVEPETTVKAEPNMTMGQGNALRKATDYLDYAAFSFSGLVNQLEYEGFSNEDSVWAVEHCGADWNDQALLKAKGYLDYGSFSFSGLVKQLEYEGFSNTDATQAAERCGADWNEQAALKAKGYLEYSSFSRQGLIDQLLYEGFSSEQAEYGVKAVGY